MARLMIYVLGSFSVTVDGKPIVFAYDKVRALLAYLAVENSQAHRREKLAGLLWPDQPQQIAQDNLRQALSRLRQALNASQSFPPFFLVNHETIRLNKEADIWIDMQAFHEHLAVPSHHPHRHPQTCSICASHRQAASQLYRGAFLNDLSLPDSDLFENWAAVWREKLLGMVVEALNQQAEYSDCLHDETALRQSVSRLLDLDPFNEPAHLHFMRLLIRSGKRNQAISHYQRLSRTLMEELGVEPSAPLVMLYEQIQSGSADTQSKPRLNPLSSSMPAPATSLVGRSAELNELVAWLVDPSRRLISIVGPGGIGKTRLAVAVVESQASAFTDGAAFIPLSQASPGASLAYYLGEAFHLTPQNPSQAEQRWFLPTGLVEFFKNRDFLLVLDGFESLLAERDLVNRLLEDSPGLVVLVTSRERLGLPGEWVLRLGGLDVPPPAILDEIEQYSAVELFLQSGRKVNAGFALTEENRASIGEICRLVDGIPLALSLAAAWVSILSPKDICQEIHQGLDLLTRWFLPTEIGGGEKEESLSIRAVFDQSWRRLSEMEQRCFSRLSVFRGGLDRQAALRVAGADLVVLAGLVDKSFLLGSSEGRFNLHDLLRQYGAEKLAEFGETDQIRRNHFEYYLQEAEKNEQLLFHGSDPFTAFVWLVREQSNLHAALEWSSSGSPPHDEAGSVRLAQLIHDDIHGAGVHLLMGSWQGHSNGETLPSS